MKIYNLRRGNHHKCFLFQKSIAAVLTTNFLAKVTGKCNEQEAIVCESDDLMEEKIVGKEMTDGEFNQQVVIINLNLFPLLI